MHKSIFIQTKSTEGSQNSLFLGIGVKKKVFSFTYFERLHTKSDFERVFKNGLRFENKNIRILVYKRNDGNIVRRLGLVTPKRVGTSVVRNRTKRKLREIFRTNKHLLVPSVDLVFVSKPETTLLCYDKLRNSVLSLLKKFIRVP